MQSISVNEARKERIRSEPENTKKKSVNPLDFVKTNFELVKKSVVGSPVEKDVAPSWEWKFNIVAEVEEQALHLDSCRTMQAKCAGQCHGACTMFCGPGSYEGPRPPQSGCAAIIACLSNCRKHRPGNGQMRVLLCFFSSSIFTADNSVVSLTYRIAKTWCRLAARTPCLIYSLANTCTGVAARFAGMCLSTWDARSIPAPPRSAK